MPTRNVVLTEYQAKLVERLLSSGRYQNASDVLREGLRLVERQEAEGTARIKALRDAARVGIADIEGQYRTFNAPADLEHHLGTLRDIALRAVRTQEHRRRTTIICRNSTERADALLSEHEPPSCVCGRKYRHHHGSRPRHRPRHGQTVCRLRHARHSG